MPGPVVLALYELNRRSLRQMIRRHAFIGIPMIVIGLLLGGERLAFTLPLYAGFLLVGLPVLAPTALGTDRGNGTLEFLCRLPVRGPQLALGRVLALCEGALLTGLWSGAALLVFLWEPLGAWGGLAAGLLGLLGVTLMMVGTGTTLLWLSLRFRPETLVAAIPVGLLMLVLIAMVFRPSQPSLGGIWTSVLGLEHALFTILGLATILALAQTVLAFRFLAGAFDRCVRNPERAKARSH